MKKNCSPCTPGLFHPSFIQKEKSKHERSNQGTKVPRLSTLDIQKRSLHLKVSVGLAHFVRTFPHWGPERSRRRRCRWYWDSRQVGYQRMLVFLGAFLGELTGVHSRLKIDRVHLSHHFRNEDVSFSHSFKLPVPKGSKRDKNSKNILTSTINRPSSINLLNQWQPSTINHHQLSTFSSSRPSHIQYTAPRFRWTCRCEDPTLAQGFKEMSRIWHPNKQQAQWDRWGRLHPRGQGRKTSCFFCKRGSWGLIGGNNFFSQIVC